MQSTDSHTHDSCLGIRLSLGILKIENNVHVTKLSVSSKWTNSCFEAVSIRNCIPVSQKC